MSVCEIADKTAHPNCALKRLTTVLPQRLKGVSVDFYGVKCYYCKSCQQCAGV